MERTIEIIDDGFYLGVETPEILLKPSSSTAVSVEVSAEVANAAAEAEAAFAEETAEGVSAAETVKIPDRLYFKIGDVAELVGVKAYVLRYWETEFPMISPEKSNTGQRLYRRVDVETVLLIKHLLYREKYSIEGARKRIQELKRAGKLKGYKQQKLFGGAQAAQAFENLKAVREAARDLNSLIQIPMKDLFRY